MDDDLESLARERLIAEISKLRRGIRQHRDSSGHDFSASSGAVVTAAGESRPVPIVQEWLQFVRSCIRYLQSLDRAGT